MKVIKLPNGGIIIQYINGDKFWFLNSSLHREDGPAFENGNGDKRWYLNGKLHREDGPAIDLSDGYKRWYLNSKLIPCTTQKEFERLMKLKAFW